MYPYCSTTILLIWIGEKARLQKHVAPRSSETKNAPSNEREEESQLESSSEHGLPFESDVAFIWQDMSGITDEDHDLSPPQMDEHDDSIRAMPGTQTLS